MDSRTNFKIQTSLNLGKATTTIAVTASMLLGGALPSVSVPYATERRFGSGAGGGAIELDSQGPLDPQPIDDSRPIAGTAITSQRLIWRAVPHNAAIEELKREGFWWFQGGPTDPGSSRKRLHLRVPALTGDAAAGMARSVIESSGGDASNLVVTGPGSNRDETPRAVELTEESRSVRGRALRWCVCR